MSSMCILLKHLGRKYILGYKKKYYLTVLSNNISFLRVEIKQYTHIIL